MEDANSHPPFQVGVLSFTEHGYPLSSTLRSTSLCAVKPFPRHRARLTQFHGLQRHIPLLGVCLLRPPGTHTLNRNCLLPPSVPGRMHCPCTRNVLHNTGHPQRLGRNQNPPKSQGFGLGQDSSTERKKPILTERLLLYHSYHSIVSGPVSRETYGKLQSVVIDG